MHVLVCLPQLHSNYPEKYIMLLKVYFSYTYPRKYTTYLYVFPVFSGYIFKFLKWLKLVWGMYIIKRLNHLSWPSHFCGENIENFFFFWDRVLLYRQSDLRRLLCRLSKSWDYIQATIMPSLKSTFLTGFKSKYVFNYSQHALPSINILIYVCM